MLRKVERLDTNKIASALLKKNKEKRSPFRSQNDESRERRLTSINSNSLTPWVLLDIFQVAKPPPTPPKIAVKTEVLVMKPTKAPIPAAAPIEDKTPAIPAAIAGAAIPPVTAKTVVAATVVVAIFAARIHPLFVVRVFFSERGSLEFFDEEVKIRRVK